jgi:hypothetical protein
LDWIGFIFRTFTHIIYKYTIYMSIPRVRNLHTLGRCPLSGPPHGRTHYHLARSRHLLCFHHGIFTIFNILQGLVLARIVFSSCLLLNVMFITLISACIPLPVHTATRPEPRREAPIHDTKPEAFLGHPDSLRALFRCLRRLLEIDF